MKAAVMWDHLPRALTSAADLRLEARAWRVGAAFLASAAPVSPVTRPMFAAIREALGERADYAVRGRLNSFTHLVPNDSVYDERPSKDGLGAAVLLCLLLALDAEDLARAAATATPAKRRSRTPSKKPASRNPSSRSLKKKEVGNG